MRLCIWRAGVWEVGRTVLARDTQIQGLGSEDKQELMRHWDTNAHW